MNVSPHSDESPAAGGLPEQKQRLKPAARRPMSQRLAVLALIAMVCTLFSLVARTPDASAATPTTCPTTMALGDINSGIAAADLATGTGYLMWSNLSVHARFDPLPNQNNADHLIAVLFEEGVWKVDTNFDITEFTPADDDCLVAAIDFDANTIDTLQGTTAEINGIDSGYSIGDLAVFAEQWNGNFNAGEFDATGTEIGDPPVQLSTCPATMSLSQLNKGIAARDGAVGTGYMLWSAESIHTRFSALSPNASNADHLITVKRAAGVWKVDTNNALTEFTPASTDCLVASIDFTADTATVLEATTDLIFGLDAGYPQGDLSIVANQWNGGADNGEFEAFGTEIGDGGAASADVSVTIDDGVSNVVKGGETTYTIVVSNAGPNLDSAVAADSTFDSDLVCDYTSTSTLGATGNTAGTGEVSDTLSMPAGSTVTYTAVCGIDGDPSGAGLTSSFDVTASLTDPDLTNDSRSDLSEFFSLTTCNANMQLGDINSGMATRDLATGTGYMMWTDESAHTRFDPTPNQNSADHLVVVLHDSNGDWFVDTNTALTAFVPEADDCLVAALDFDANTAVTLQGTEEWIWGIDSGYTEGNLEVFAEQWNGNPNGGEFDAEGTEVGDSFTPQADVGITINDGVDTAQAGGAVTYTIVASNDGPVTDPVALVDINFDSFLTCSTTSVADGGATGNEAGPFSGDLNEDTVNLPLGATVTYTADCSIDGAAFGSLISQAFISGSQTDNNSGNDFASDSDTSLAVDSTCPSTMALGDLGNGIAVRDGAVGNGYLMWSSQSVHDRFPAPRPQPNAADHLIAVRRAAGVWKVDTNTALTEFTPASDDCLVAAIDFTNDTATVLLGSSGAVFGIDSGYDAGDLSVIANQWNGGPDTGEFEAFGSEVTNGGGLFANLTITNSNGQATAVAGDSVTYTIVVSNSGPNTDPAVSVTDAFPASLTCDYSSVATGAATGNTAGPASGSIGDTVSMPLGSTVTYTADCLIDQSATGSVFTDATASGSLSGFDSAFDDTTIVQYSTCPSTMTIGPINSGIAAQDTATGTGYLLWSAASVHTRFSPVPQANNADHLIAVINVDGDWQVDNNSTYTSFAPASDDCLVAAIDFDADTIDTLEGNEGLIIGMDSGYAAGDLAVFAEQWNGGPDGGEFDATGTEIGDSFTAEADVSVTIDDGVTETVGGDTLTYTIVATNNGPVPDSAVAVSSTFDAALACDVTSSNAGGATGNTPGPLFGDVSDTLNMPSGSTVTYIASCDVSKTAVGAVSSSADVVGTKVDPTPGNDSATDNNTALQLSTCPATMALNNLGKGIAARDGASGTGYILYSATSVHTRFSPAPQIDNADHLIAVRYAGGVWKVDTNNALTEFTPAAGDCLVAEVDFGADTATLLTSGSSVIYGIDAGYTSGDLTVTPNEWNGGADTGEFGLAGTSIVK